MKFYIKFIGIALFLVGYGFVTYNFGYADGYDDGFAGKYGVSQSELAIARKIRKERLRNSGIDTDIMIPAIGYQE